MDKEKLKRQRRSLLADVTHLQVDTILANAIRGVGMTDERHALIDLAQAYRAKLVELKIPAADQPPEAAMEPVSTGAGGEESSRPLKGNRAAFSWLEQTSEAAVRLPRLRADDARHALAMVRRIAAKSAELKGMLSTGGHENDYSRAQLESGDIDPLDLSHQQRIALRKSWELGTHTVVMQTVVSMDGDVVNRVTRGYADEAHKELHRLHSQAVETSLNTWKFIVESVVTFLQNVISAPRR